MCVVVLLKVVVLSFNITGQGPTSSTTTAILVPGTQAALQLTPRHNCKNHTWPPPPQKLWRFRTQEDPQFLKILKFRYKATKVNKASCNNKDTNNNNSQGPRWDMEEIKSNVALLLEGKPYEEMHEFCDFTLEEQNEVQVAKGVTPSAPADFKPVIKKSVSYIVAAVLINDQGKLTNFVYTWKKLEYSKLAISGPSGHNCKAPLRVEVKS